MNSKKFSTAVTAGCIIIFFLIVVAIKCGAQEHTFGGEALQIGKHCDPGFYTVPGRLTITEPKQDKWYSLRTYKPFTAGRITRLSVAVVQSFFDGCEEARHKDPYVFERTFGSGPVSFWGHRQDEIQYDAQGKHKPDLLNAVRDLHHFDEFLDKYGNGGIYLSVGVTQICSITRGYKKGSPPKHVWRDIFLDCVITSALQTATKSITYSSLTNSRLFHF